MSNDPYRPSNSSRSSASGSRPSGEGFRPDSNSRSPQPAPRSQPPKSSPLVPALLVAGALAVGGLALRHSQAPSSAANAQVSNAASASYRPSAQPASDKLQVLVAGDVSRSVNPALRQSAMDGLKFAFKQALPTGTPVHFVFYDREARTRPGVIEFNEPHDLDEVSTDFVKYPPRPEKGTRQALALSRLEREADSLPSGTPVAFVLLTDGEDQDAPSTTREAQKMAARPNFRGLLVVGAQMESQARMYLRDRLDASLAPLQNRRIVCGPEVSDRDADQFRALLGS